MKKETRGISKFSSFEETRVKNILSLRGVRKKYLIVVCLVKTNGPAIILFLFLSLSIKFFILYTLIDEDYCNEYDFWHASFYIAFLIVLINFSIYISILIKRVLSFICRCRLSTILFRLFPVC